MLTPHLTLHHSHSLLILICEHLYLKFHLITMVTSNVGLFGGTLFIVFTRHTLQDTIFIEIPLVYHNRAWTDFTPQRVSRSPNTKSRSSFRPAMHSPTFLIQSNGNSKRLSNHLSSTMAIARQSRLELLPTGKLRDVIETQGH